MAVTSTLFAPRSLTVEQALRQYFGFSTFQAGQREVIDQVMQGKSTLAILATGAGKSLCYQLPALLLPGTTVVVSPLIALIKDQVDILAERGIEHVAALNSSLSDEQEAAECARISTGEIKLLYVTPEKFEDQSFVALLSRLHISLFVIDEAHCISAWGHDFRPAYLSLDKVIRMLHEPTVLALTATATPSVREDILSQLGIPFATTIVRGFDRPNLCYEVFRADTEREKLDQLKKMFLGGLTGPGIIYTATIRSANEVQRALHEYTDSPVALYHSKLHKQERTIVHDLFVNESVPVVVATNAFGLGIDKANIRFVIHYDLPGSVEAYTQEAGRAGRDGNPARCVLLYRLSDRHVQSYFLTGKYPTVEDVQKVYATLELFAHQDGGVSLVDLRKISQLPLTKLKVVIALLKRADFIVVKDRSRYELSESARQKDQLVLNLTNYATKYSYDQSKLAMMLQYAENSSCRRRFILNYFGEEYPRMHCQACDNCLRKQAAGVSTHVHGATQRPAFRIADSVTHRTFGQGTVERTERDLVTVLFPTVGYKTLLETVLTST